MPSLYSVLPTKTMLEKQMQAHDGHTSTALSACQGIHIKLCANKESAHLSEKLQALVSE